MKFPSNVCPKCDAEIFSDAAEGLCTACLLETGLGLFTEAVGGVDDSGRTTNLCGSVEMPQREQRGPSKSARQEVWATTNCWKKSAAEARA